MLYNFDVIAFEAVGLPGVRCREQMRTAVQNDWNTAFGNGFAEYYNFFFMWRKWKN